MVAKKEVVQSIVRPSNTEVMRSFGDMWATIPMAGEEDWEAKILGDILFSQNLEDVNDMFDDKPPPNYMGETLVIDSVARQDSTFEDGRDQYLFCNVRVGGPQGEVSRWSTSSLTAIAVLVRANLEGRIPGLIVRPQVSVKQTKAGYNPVNLVVLGQADAILQ